jgi:3-hydroxyacyl-CoA dehydrogenase
MRMHNAHSAKRLAEAAALLAAGTVSNGADHARALGYLRPTDVTVYHPDGLLMAAKNLVLNAEVVTPSVWTTPEGPISGMIDRSLQELRGRGELTEYDTVIGDKIRLVFAKAMSYENALDLERTEFIDLCGRALTHARIRHMLESGKPLRN